MDLVAQRIYPRKKSLASIEIIYPKSNYTVVTSIENPINMWTKKICSWGQKWWMTKVGNKGTTENQ